MTMTVPTTVPMVGVKLRGTRLLKLACWLGRQRGIPASWRVSMVWWAMNRLSFQLGDGPVLPMWKPAITPADAHWYMDA